MKNKNQFGFIFVLFILLMSLFISCTLIVDGENKNNQDNQNSKTVMYVFRNYSSHVITLTDSSGSVDIQPGYKHTAYFGKTHSIDDVKYQPANLVSVSKTSNVHFDFTDK